VCKKRFFLCALKAASFGLQLKANDKSRKKASFEGQMLCKRVRQQKYLRDTEMWPHEKCSVISMGQSLRQL